MPHTLLSAMWLQFAQTIAGSKRFRACKVCGRWIEISKEKTGKRINRLFCSDSCKSWDYRRKREQAVQLQAEGKKPREIASTLGTGVDKVKAWLKASKSKRKAKSQSRKG
jgi:predicted nucleic acid-binding Zn ribbon protein